MMNLEPLPIVLEEVVPESYLDENGHMNVMWYIHLFGQATGWLLDQVGLTPEYFLANQTGIFALEHHFRYLVEVRAGQHITIRTRVLGRTAKRLHIIHFLVNDDRGILAATGEFVDAHVDLKIRRTSPFPPAIAAAFDRLLVEHARLGWDPLVFGVMKP